jgi:hypothetical protein
MSGARELPSSQSCCHTPPQPPDTGIIAMTIAFSSAESQSRTPSSIREPMSPLEISKHIL